jgi:hypothetical protein
MRYEKKKLIALAKKITEKKNLTPDETIYLLNFDTISKDSKFVATLKKITLPIALGFGFIFSAFPQEFKDVTTHLPGWTNLSVPMLTGVDYLWDLLGEPVKKANLLYHIPNIILYSFGFFGIKKLMDAIDRRTWLDNVLNAKKTLSEQIVSGTALFSMEAGHSLLFVGNGDFIGMQFVLNHTPSETVTISQSKPAYTRFWSYYNIDGFYDDLHQTLIRASGETAGEYVFFPIKDDQIFLPGEKSYDLPPHKLDILCQNIRTIEKKLQWKAKRIIIIGDKLHKSVVHSEDHKAILPHSEDIISLESITKKYPNVTLLDPSDIVLKKILTIAKGRKIVFRATKEGIAEYKTRFYERLSTVGYHPTKNKKGILTIGYDIFEDQTEQQTLSRTIDDYFPVVLSKNVHDALMRNGYKKSDFLYVPDLVLQKLTEEAQKQ